MKAWLELDDGTEIEVEVEYTVDPDDPGTGWQGGIVLESVRDAETREEIDTTEEQNERLRTKCEEYEKRLSELQERL